MTFRIAVVQPISHLPGDDAIHPRPLREAAE
jgi:hypothetical protein